MLIKHRGFEPQVHDRLSVMKKATEVRSKEFESHLNDKILP
jgi:hypothetical protein